MISVGHVIDIIYQAKMYNKAINNEIPIVVKIHYVT